MHSDITEEQERAISGELPSVAPLALKSSGSLTKGKGKGKQGQREQSVDSVSMASRGTRKKATPRKKPDPISLDALGPASVSASVDMTPNVSRPTSPALVSSVVYELDEPIPALKRAKKVDDAAMLKRVKTLEDSQRKMWTNIARRDVAKVRFILLE